MEAQTDCERQMTSGETFDLLKSRVLAANKNFEITQRLANEYNDNRDKAAALLQQEKSALKKFIREQVFEPNLLGPQAPVKRKYPSRNDDDDLEF